MRTRKFAKPENHQEHPNVVPLIDVILCTIVFYMLVAKIGVNTGRDESITLPVTVVGKELDQAGTLLVNVREVGDRPDVTALALGSDNVQSFPLSDPSTGRNALLALLQRFRVGADGREGTPDDAKNPRVIVRADAGMSFRSFAPVLKTVYDSGVQNVAYTTKSG